MQNPSVKNPGSNLTINDFEILNKLGKGSFGVVYKVKRKSNKNTYVLKQINISSMKSKMRSIALNEVKILSSLENPYVVKYYDSFIERDNLNIIMEYCEGGDLAQYIKSHMGKPLSETKIWKFFIQMCIGMRYIHSKKILHRDIKALNIFLTKEGDIRIGDLGVAKVLAESVSFAHTMVGTPYYLSPEMCEERPYNEKSDIWALGCVLYEMCTQRHPFQAHSQGTLILKIIKGHYTPIPGTYSSELSEIVNLCLNKDYKKRLTAGALLERPAMVEKTKTLGITIPELDKKPIMGLNPIMEEPAVKKSKTKANKEKAREQEVKIPLAKKEEKPKKPEINDGKINVFGKLEPQKVDAKVSPSNRIIEYKPPVPEKNVIPKPEPAKVEWVKVNAEVKPTPIVNEKPEVNPVKNIVPQRHKDNALGPEIVAKAVSEGKKAPYIVVSGEKIANKEAQAANKDRVRKGAPNELGRQAKIAGSQQKLVKKAGGEPLRINRPVPVLLEDKEKAPIVRPSVGSQKNLLSEQNVGPTAQEINEVKNLPDIVKPNPRPKEVVTPQSFNIFSKEPSKPVNNFKEAVQREQKPITEEKPTGSQPTIEIIQRHIQEPVGKGIVNKVEQPPKRVEEVKIEDKMPKEENERGKAKEIKEVQELPVKSQEKIEEHDNKPEYEEEQEEEEAETNDEEIEEMDGDAQEVPRRALQFGYNAFPKVNWKITEGERNAKIVRKGDAQDVEEHKAFDSDLNDRDEEFEEERNHHEEEEGNGDIMEESNEESSEEEENNENEDEEDQEEEEELQENPDEDIKTLSKVVLEKRLNKSMKKREKVQDLVREIRSNQFIKSLGDDRFGQIINFFRLKLESDEEINEEDQDEIEQFLKGKLPADIQVQVIYNIYRLLGLQIELQKCDDDIKKYSDVLA